MIRRATCVLLFAWAAGCASKGASPAASSGAGTTAAGVTAPPPGGLAVDGDVTTARASGIEVIVKRIPGAELVSGSIFVRGGVRNWGKDDAGVEHLACAVAARGGTEKMPKEIFARRLAALGSHVFASSGEAYSVFSAKGLQESWDATFALLTDVFMAPALPASEIEVQRTQQLTALRQELDDPDAYLTLRAHQELWKGHPHENRSIGTLETVAKLQRPALLAQLAKLREQSRLLVVVVGDLDAATVVAQVAATLGTLPVGAYVDQPPPPLNFTQPSLVTVARKLPTNYISGQFTAPSWRDPSFVSGMVAMEVLSSRVFEEVRTKRNLSYAPAAFLRSASHLPIGGLYVTATDTNTTMKVMLDEARKLRDLAVPAKELEGNKSVFLTRYLMRAETTDGQVAMLGNAQIYGGDWRFARRLPELIRAVTPADVQAFATRNISRLQTVVLGDPDRVDRATLTGL